MNITQMIHALEREMALTRTAIARLQLLEAAQKRHETFKVRDRRGRKFMPPEEREQVSARMRRFWANKRQEKTA